MNPIVNIWLKSPKISNQSKNFIMNMSNELKDDAFKDTKMEFGTAGIRQLMGPGTNRMNAYTYQQMAEGYAHFILANKSKNEFRKIIIGHDNRSNADMFAIVCAKVISSFGIEVYLYSSNELMPTPILSYTIRKNGYDGGIMITASHNPKEYLGFKAYNNVGGQISNIEAKFIVNKMPDSITILNNEYKHNDDLIKYLNNEIIENYFEDAKECLIKTDVNESKKFPIVFTAHHGTASYLMPRFLEKLGYTNVIPCKQQCVPDPNFTYSLISNPEDPKSFELSEKYAERTSAEIMLGVDPDADRLAVVVKHNGYWRYLTGNEMGIIYTYYVLNNKKFNKKPFIVSTYVSTYLIDSIADYYGAKLYRTGTGFKNLGEIVEKKHLSEDFVVAFEEAIGSLNSTINRDKDSFQAAALALEIHDFYRKENKTLIDVLENDIFPIFGYWAGGTLSFTFQGTNWVENMNQKMDYFNSYKGEQLYDVVVHDVKWNNVANALEWNLGDNMWIKFRMSGTEPKFKAYFNIYGNSQQEAEERYHQLKEIIKELMIK